MQCAYVCCWALAQWCMSVVSGKRGAYCAQCAQSDECAFCRSCSSWGRVHPGTLLTERSVLAKAAKALLALVGCLL